MYDNQTPQPLQFAAQPQPETTKPVYKKTWFIALLGLGGLLLVAAVIMSLAGGRNSGASDTFYGMIEAVAQKTKIRYAYTLTQPERNGQTGIVVKSLAEYDAAAGIYSSAYATEAITAGASRCVKGKEYRSAAEDTFPEDMKAAEELLRGPFKPSDGRFGFNECDFQKSRYVGDFTDGMLAVGISSAQAKNMADELRKTNPAKLTNLGKATYKGKAARKIGFEVGKTLGTSYQSDAFFYAFRDGASSKVGANVPVQEISKHFDGAFQLSPVGLKGFYLIDETTNLPLYRYLETVADNDEGADFAPQTVLSEYAFPDTLTMDEKTQLPELARQ
ncbi:MAG TPA: hypothetical protein VF733_06265 [Candidatus Saccharimonadales bacterium]